jgi:hypothetical protein
MSEANDKIAEAVAEGDLERAERLKEYYFGENGILRNIQDELSIAQENLNEIGQELGGEGWTSAFAEFTEAIVNVTDKEWELFVGTSDDVDQENNGLTGLISTTKQSLNDVTVAISTATATFGDATRTFDGLFGENGSLTSAIGDLGVDVDDLTKLSTDVGQLQTDTKDILTKLGGDEGLIKKVQGLTDILSAFATNYKNWLEKQETELDQNTEAIRKSTKAMLTLADMLDNAAADGSVTIKNWKWDEEKQTYFFDTNAGEGPDATT